MQSFLQLYILTVRIFFLATSVTPALQQNRVPRSKSVLARRKWLRNWRSQYGTRQTQSNGYLGCTRRLGSLYRHGQRMFGSYHHLALHKVFRFSTRHLQFTACTLTWRRGFNSQRGFSWTWSIRSHYGHDVDSESKRNTYQQYLLGVKAAGV